MKKFQLFRKKYFTAKTEVFLTKNVSYLHLRDSIGNFFLKNLQRFVVQMAFVRLSKLYQWVSLPLSVLQLQKGLWVEGTAF